MYLHFYNYHFILLCYSAEYGKKILLKYRGRKYVQLPIEDQDCRIRLQYEIKPTLSKVTENRLSQDVDASKKVKFQLITFKTCLFNNLSSMFNRSG